MILAMSIQLKKPIVFFDLETTGINIVTDRIVEIAYLKVYPDGKEESACYRVNPTIPIGAEATRIHGITNADVKDAPEFKAIARDLAKIFDGADFAGYNSNKFDIPLLAEEFLRAEVDFDMKKRRFVDVQVIFHKMEQRTLGAAYKFYCDKNLENAHSALADTLATYEILKAQIERYDELKDDIESLSKFSTQTRSADFAGRIVYNDKDVEIFNFGKYKGIPVEEIFEKEPGYYSWMMNGDFPLFTKKVITAIKLRKLTSKNS
jgi:DNA polymerase III subunit epsilon